MRVYELTMDESLAGLTVEQVLMRVLHLSKTQVKRAKFREDGLILDGVRVFSSHRVAVGQTLLVRLPEKERSLVEPMPGPVNIVYEDRWMAVVDKPAGLPVHPGHGHYRDTLANYLLWHYRQRGEELVPRLTNRLDKGTSGLLIFAKCAEGQTYLQALLHTPDFVRRYQAICQSVPPRETGSITLPLGKRQDVLNMYQVDPGGRPALTRYQVLDRRGGYSLVELTLGTGRTHQIRVHLSAVGCPLAGDTLYGGGEELERPALHASEIHLLHPFTGERLCWSSPVPADMKTFWRNLI